MTKDTKTPIHAVARITEHRHFPRFLRGLHIGAVGISIWAVAAAWFTVASLVSQPALAETGTTLSGRVLAGGAPVPVNKVQIQIMQQGQPPSGPGSTTDAAGNFTLSNLTPGGNYMFQVFITDSTFPYLSKNIQNVTIVSGANNIGDIALTAATKTLNVTVVRSSTGAGVSGVNVNAFKMGDPMNANAMTNSSGTAALMLSGGTWGLNVSGPFGPNGPEPVDWVYVGEPLQIAFTEDGSTETKSQTITVQNATATVTGIIKYPDGTAAANLGLNLRNSSNAMINGNTNNTGQFTIKVVSGSYEFSCWLPPEKAQFSCPSSAFSISDNETKDFGIITLGQKTARITGAVTCAGNPAANINVSAFPMQQQSGPPSPGDQAWTQTAADGTYTLYVKAGTLGINAFAPPQSNCVSPGGPPTSVTIADNQTVSGTNFSLILADVTINGIIKDTSGNTISNFFGYANAMDASGSFGPGKQFGGPLQNGTFQIKLPSSAMSKATINVFPPPQGTQYSIKNPVTLDIAANQTYGVTLVAAQNDASLSGMVKDNKGNALSNASGEAFLSNETNTEFKHSRIEQGRYNFSLLGGAKWRLGYRIEGNYINQPPGEAISVAAGQNVIKDISVTATDATIQVMLKDPNGNLVPHAFAHAHQPFNQTLSTKELPRESGAEVREGQATINVLGGFTYMVSAGLPPEFADLNYMPPQEQTVKPVAGGSVSVTLQLRKADGSLKGTAKLPTGGNASFGFVGCWSENGSHTGGPMFNGTYSVSLTKDDTWHCHGNSNSNTTEFYDTGEFTVTTGSTTGFTLTKDLTLIKSSIILPQPVTETVDATQQKIVTLSDGTIITIPAGAFGAEGTFTVTAQPTVNLTPAISAKPALGFGYTLGVTNSSGTAVTTFNSAVTVTFPYNAEAVTKLGILPTDLVPKYYDTTTNTWQDVSSVTVNTTEQTITFTTDHFTDFALVTAKGGATLQTVTTGVSTKTGLSYFRVGSKTVTPFTCKGTLRVSTQLVSGTQLIVSASSCTGTAKVYDAAGTLKKSLATGWSGVNTAAFIDVTKDKAADIILAPVFDKTVQVYNVAKSYAKMAVTANSYKARLTAKGIDLNNQGNANLVSGRIASGVVKDIKVFKYASGAFTVSTTPYLAFLKSVDGKITLSIPNPAVTKFSTTSVAKTSTAAKITLTGTNFTPDMTVTIGGVKAKVTYVSRTSVTITFNATTLTKGLSYALKLKNPFGITVTTTTKVKIK